MCLRLRLTHRRVLSVAVSVTHICHEFDIYTRTGTCTHGRKDSSRCDGGSWKSKKNKYCWEGSRNVAIDQTMEKNSLLEMWIGGPYRTIFQILNRETKKRNCLSQQFREWIKGAPNKSVTGFPVSFTVMSTKFILMKAFSSIVIISFNFVIELSCEAIYQSSSSIHLSVGYFSQFRKYKKQVIRETINFISIRHYIVKHITKLFPPWRGNDACTASHGCTYCLPL